MLLKVRIEDGIFCVHTRNISPVYPNLVRHNVVADDLGTQTLRFQDKFELEQQFPIFRTQHLMLQIYLWMT
jgi:hypothetical protein